MKSALFFTFGTLALQQKLVSGAPGSDGQKSSKLLPNEIYARIGDAMPAYQHEEFGRALNFGNNAVYSLMRSPKIRKGFESHDKDIASRTEPWFKEWISKESPADYVRRTPAEIANDKLAWPPHNLVAGPNNEFIEQRLLDQDYQILRNTHLDVKVRDEYITEIREYMQDTIWPVAKPLVEATLYRRFLVGILRDCNVTPLGNVYANAQVPPYPSYPLASEENVEGVTIVSNEDSAAYHPGVEAAIANRASNMNTSLPGAIRDFRPELRTINNAARLIKFDDIIYQDDKANLALRFPQALLFGDLRYLNNLQRDLDSGLGRYGVMDILHQGSGIPTSHLQFMEMILSGLHNKDDEMNAIDRATTGPQAPSLAQVTSIMQGIYYRRAFRATGEFYQKEVEKVFRHSVVVAFAALGMLDHLHTYLTGRTLGNAPISNRKDEQNLAILVADRLNQSDHVGKIQKRYQIMSEDESCDLKGSGLYLGWEPRTDILKSLVQRCGKPNPSPAFKNDLPVYIGAGDKLYFLTYDPMVTTEPTTLQ